MKGKDDFTIDLRNATITTITLQSSETIYSTAYIINKIYKVTILKSALTI